MHGIKSSISAIAVHPTKPQLAIAGADGFILLWDYMKKGDPISNYEHFNKETRKDDSFKYFTCIEFTPDGQEILVAQHNGDIKVIDAETVQFKKLNTPLKISDRSNKNHATQLIITHDGKYFAVCDNNSCVSLFRKDHLNNDITKPIDWFFNGKIKSHELGVTSITFGHGLDEQGVPMHRLFSIG